MSEIRLTQITAFGRVEAQTASFGDVTLTERPDLAIASVAARHGQESTVRSTLEQMVGGALEVSSFREGNRFSAFWTGPSQWFVMADHDDYETLAASLKETLSRAASITEQNDGWVGFDMDGTDCDAVLERLCNIDLSGFTSGRAQRTVIEHVSCFVLCRKQGCAYRIFCGRSYALSLWHALATTVASATAVAKLATH
ncbi:sarcosine oxidase subunit gamma [Actibacterium pelagium]|uniref:Sarcosine oxidase subunit gamma n=1 Tax=Actibacterium pelagium TaxID=2029103 RepID=A0A917EKE0_9RHOB|nr:sarcosine oxidase subunit gamma [Actibacterium pelagium]GGE48674.1 hypothetical protein GCM10011517_15670 [Actibacterium pelagium]